MGFEHSVSFLNRIKGGLQNCRGISLLLIVFLMTAAAVSAVGVLMFEVKLRAVKKERMVPERLETIRRALQRYYLSHHDLPSPTYPLNTDLNHTVPVKALNLPQEYRFDAAGQFIRYDRVPFSTDTVDIKGLTVQGKEAAAVLVAPGPDRQVEATNSEPSGQPNDTIYDQTGDDIVVAVPLQAEAIKIATRAVAVLQAAAKAYDAQYDSLHYHAQFDNANNDGDYLLTTTMGATVLIDPGPDFILGTIDDFVDISDGGDGFCDGTDVPPPRRIDIGLDGIPDTADDTYDCRVLISLVGKIDEGNEMLIAHGYNGYVPATGGNIFSSGCVKVAQLTNDPERGTASLDGCTTAVDDIVAVFGLSERYAVDPWGNKYVWGSVEWVEGPDPHTDYGGLAETETSSGDTARNRHYWSFFSSGPDETRDTPDDITPTTDRIDGYHSREPPP
ncbi:MAG: hypothetical protein SRB2_02551 [Desulfobacteraceae bacterium Eth-SRB2]|nr:MAG: hypothetical protein SRB2_02551 [Desulfobacteraceae bacterium Eth-SRB2]